MTFEEIWLAIKQWLLSDAIWDILLKILISLILLMVSFKIINSIARKMERRVNDKRFDKTIMKTLAYLFKLVTKIIVIITIIGFLGIDTSGITALVASFGVCIGLAVNGAVANIAGGVLILVTRPFKVDDYIEAQGYEGTVTDIRLTATKIVTFDNKVVYIPNGALANGNIVNYSEKEIRRVDMNYSIAYADDFNKAREVLLGVCATHPLILSDPAPFIGISEHSSSAIIVSVKAWVKTNDYWTVYFDLNERVKFAFDENEIHIPFNQLDVHVKKED